MKIVTKDGKEIELSEESIKALKEAFKEEKPVESLKPKMGEKYFLLGSGGVYGTCRWDSDDAYIYAYSQGNVFLSKEAVEKERDKRTAIMRVREYIANNFGVFEPDWEDQNQRKYTYFYDHDCVAFDCDYAWADQEYSPFGYLRTYEDAQQLIKDCETDLKIIFEVE